MLVLVLIILGLTGILQDFTHESFWICEITVIIALLLTGLWKELI